MPSLDGIGLALKVAKDFPSLPVLLMTGYSAERQRAHNLEELICEVITKPFTLQEICEAAEAALTAEQMPCHYAGPKPPQPSELIQQAVEVVELERRAIAARTHVGYGKGVH